MELRLSAFALWCAVVVAARASAYTVDCDPTITDCAALLGKLSLPADAEEASTTAQTTTTTKQHRETTTEESKPQPRLLNLSVDELQNFANALHNQTDNLSKKLSDLSDVTLDGDEDEELPKMEFKNKIANRFFSNLREPFNPLQPSLEKKSDEVDTCMEKEASYKIGDVINRGCEESCECMPGGIFDCSPRCKHPYIRIGKSLNDPLCFESPVDECCSIIACSTGNEMKGVKIEVCRHLNDTYQLGAKWHIGCEQTCTCEKNSVVTCKPRCSPLPPSDKCINVQDPKDECCEVQVCDVSQDVHEVLENSTSTTTTTQSPRLQELTTRTFTRPLVLPEPIGSIKVLQNNTVRVNLIHPNNTEDPIHLLLSNDGGKTFKGVELTYTNLILNLKGGKDYILKTKETGTKFNFTITAMDDMSGEKEIVEKIGCHQDGAFYAVGEEFHIGCTELCECTGKETRECAALVCPSHVGLELISKGCVRWAPSPPAEPPNCCPRSARCLSDGTCHYKGVPVPNWSEVPISLTGCEERCFCENGDLDCQEVCSPLSPVPPQTLRCPPMHRPTPVNISDEDCCKQWGCEPNGHAIMPPDFTPKPQTTQQQSFLPTIPPEIHFPQDDIADYDQNNIHRPVNPLVPGDIPGLPPGLHVPPNYGEDNKKLSVISLQSDSPTSVKMLFGLPPVLVGLRGSVDLRYTDKPDEDISQWYSQVFAPADEVLTTPRLEFRLTGLKPSTPYKIRGKLYLHNLPVEPESEVYAVRTQDLPTMPPVEEKKREIDSRLTVVDANDTTAHISWRHFSEDELQFIDGIQVRYRPVGTPIYSMTELLHHTKTLAELHSLRPGSRYEASLVLIPPPRATTELHDPGKVEFNTASYIDPYNWSVTVEAVSIGSIAAELTWRGIPSPPERWVRVYRAASTCGERDSSAEHDAFRLAHRDITPKLTLTSLLPDTRCRVWLELFLTNGKVKTSNVLEIHTKSLDSPQPIDNEIEAASISGGRTVPRGDYYGALVVVGVVAALGAVTSLLLLLVVVRRHRPRSVPITSPRESSLPPYDNPAYKLELQQETMDL